MDFLRNLFKDQALTYVQLVELITNHNSAPENKGNQINVANIANGEYVSKNKFQDKEKEIATLNTTLTSLQDSVKKFDGVDVEALKNAALQAKTDAQKEIAAIKLNSGIDLKLHTIGAKNPKAVKGLLDLTKVVLEGEEIKGLDDQLEALVKSDDYLFAPKQDTNKDSSKTAVNDNPFQPFVPTGASAQGAKADVFDFGFTGVRDVPKN
ncbi:MAG: phage scaffolding protein [Anaerorhabdus sp.]|uniref:phage scaffolding protein n=1 Tax=Anaerorhabdus sp. TaxID=1872524 RepID=UPI003A8B4D4F